MVSKPLLRGLDFKLRQCPGFPSKDNWTSEMLVSIDQLRRDGGTQPRVHISEDVVRRYAEDMAAGAAFPPVVAFYDGVDY